MHNTHPISEQRYRTLADAMPQLVWATDANGSHFYYNRRWYEYTGLSEADSLGFGFGNALHPDDKQRTLERWQRAWRNGESYEIEYRFRRYDGVYHWFIGRAMPVYAPDGTIVEWVGTCTDIDEQKRAMEVQRFIAEASTLLASSLDYKATLTRIAQLAVPHLADWCAVDILEGNGALKRLAVAHVDPAKVDLAWRLDRDYPTDLNAPNGIAQVLRSGQPEIMPEISDDFLRAIVADPILLDIMLTLGLRSWIVVPLTAHSRTFGTLTLVAAESGRIFTTADLELAEDLARRAATAIDNAQLHSQLQQRSDELTQLAAELEERNRELDQFAYVTSHDLKAPLRGIANLSQWIEEDLGEQITAEVQAHLELLRGRAHRMEALIDGILQYSRVGRAPGAAETVDVGRLLDEVIDLQGAGKDVTIRVAPGMPTLRTARLPLQQVFANLIGNAVKHHPGPQVEIDITARDQGRFYEFAVADNGAGIAPQYHERIFGIFQTLASRDKVEGSGLGLALIKKIVEHQRGQVWLRSQEGAGATFYFTWPKES